MSSSIDPALTKRFAALVPMVREASHSCKVLPLGEVWPGTEDEFIECTQTRTETGSCDIMLIRDGGRTYVYSEQHMTRAYAEAAARACCPDILQMISETVRGDSRTYPRPTPVVVFEESPFLLSHDTVARALEDISGNPKYLDIHLLRASNGSLFLFSSMHMNPEHAVSLAEWIAVDHLQNP